MNWAAESLWHLVQSRFNRRDANEVSPPPPRPAPASRMNGHGHGHGDLRPAATPVAKPALDVTPRAPLMNGEAAAAKRNGRLTMQQRYDALVVEMKRRYGIRVHRWRTSTSGVAWEVQYTDGRVSRLIESPRPRGPMSCAVFLHEVGHHAIGFRRYRPRCLEEFHAWRFALETMREHHLNVTPAVEKRMRDALRYAVRKAQRRGLRRIPPELLPYL